MMIPGRAVEIVTVTSFSVRSMMIFEMLAFCRRTFRYLRILASSTSLSEKSLPPNQLESQPRMIPRRYHFVYYDRNVIRTLADAVCASLRSGLNTLQHTTAIDEDLLHAEFRIFQALVLVLGLPVGDSRLEELLHADRCLLLRVTEDAQCLVDLHTADDIGHQAHLAGRGRAVAHHGDCLLLLFSLQFFGSICFSCTHFLPIFSCYLHDHGSYA